MSNIIQLHDRRVPYREPDAKFWKDICGQWRDFAVQQREYLTARGELLFVAGFCAGCLFTFLMGLI